MLQWVWTMCLKYKHHPMYKQWTWLGGSMLILKVIKCSIWTNIPSQIQLWNSRQEYSWFKFVDWMRQFLEPIQSSNCMWICKCPQWGHIPFCWIISALRRQDLVFHPIVLHSSGVWYIGIVSGSMMVESMSIHLLGGENKSACFYACVNHKPFLLCC